MCSRFLKKNWQYTTFEVESSLGEVCISIDIPNFGWDKVAQAHMPPKCGWQCHHGIIYGIINAANVQNDMNLTRAVRVYAIPQKGNGQQCLFIRPRSDHSLPMSLTH